MPEIPSTRLGPRVFSLDLGHALVQRRNDGIERGARTVVDADRLALPRQYVELRRRAGRGNQRANLVGLVRDPAADLDGEHGEQLGLGRRDRHALLDAGTAPLAEHDDVPRQRLEVRLVAVYPRREALVVGLGREQRRSALCRDAVVGDLDAAVGAVQLHLCAILDDRERMAELPQMLERADDIVEELDARPGDVRGGHDANLSCIALRDCRASTSALAQSED